MRTAFYGLLSVAALFIVSDAEAQIFRRNMVRQNVVPHTSTHIDYQRHGNHVDAVPHTTTHYDRVPHNTYNQPRVIYPQGQINTHTDLVPHTSTHIDYQRHGNHIDAVPHTTTHLDAVPHTTTHVHP